MFLLRPLTGLLYLLCTLLIARFFIDINPQILHCVSRDCKLTMSDMGNILGNFNIHEVRRKDLTPRL